MEIQVKHTKLQHAHKVEVTITDGDETHTASDVALTARDAYKHAYRKARTARSWGVLADIMIDPTDPATRAIAFMRLQLRGYEHAVRRLVTDARALADERDEPRERIKAAREHEQQLAAAREENLRLRQQLDAALDARTQAEQTLDTIQDMLKAAGIIGHVRNSVAQAIAKARQADDWKQRYQDLHEQQARRELQRDGDSAGSDSARLAAQTLRAAGYTGDDLECMVKAAIDRAAHYQRMYSKAEMERAQLFEQIKRNYGAPPATAERKAEADEPSEAPETSTAPHEAA